jgi:PIN domain nuclease of toxin-antitoxin system
MRDGISFEDAKVTLSRTLLKPLDFTRELAELAARISSPETRARGISLGDRACLATALHAGLPVVSADRAWARLKIHHLKIEFIR